MSRFGAPPESDLDVRPTPEDVSFFAENGYLVVPQITTAEELAWLTDVFCGVMEDNAGTPVFEAGRQPDQTLPAQILQCIGPELRIPELLDTTFRRNARHFAAAFLGVPESEVTTWGHMINKKAGSRRPAPWHQDQAYWEPELDYLAVGAWLPLHDVAVEQGAMQFIPGSHRSGLRYHGFEGDPSGNLLKVDGVDPSLAAPCPLPAGGCTFHHYLTLHYTAPNDTDRDRLAFATEFQVMPWRRATPVQWPWVQQYRAAVNAPSGPPAVIADGKFVTV
ncbi:MAG TPA: phytanoyl-CoA dioxygenase family protein [Acidimicrobiales bacterium]|nr:phytanoyl-CoA dioxygenase family protein [Acidimicrobiales bacterium]